MGKIKDSVILKKEMFQTGQQQHQRTETVKIEHNPYAEARSMESLTKAGSTRYNSSQFAQ